MKILIYGAGAVGGYLGGKLALAGQQVTLITRPSITSALNHDGLLISESGQTYRTAVRAVCELSEAFTEAPDYDLVILTVKSYDLSEAVGRLAEAWPGAPRILSTQNGIGLEEIIAGRFDAGRTLAGSVTIPISRAGPNHLMVEAMGRGMGLAPVEPGQEVQSWVELFCDAGIQTGAIADYRAMKWSKAFLNIMGNATSAILNRSPAELYRMESIFDLEMRMLREMLAVMKRMGLPVINLPGATARPLARSLSYLPRLLLRLVFSQVVIHGRGDKMPSFHIDLAHGKGRSEVEFHNGAIAAAEKQWGVAVPVNAALNDVLIRLSQGLADREDFDGRPDRLLEVVDRYDKGGVFA